MVAWRITRRIHLELDGEGARRFGGRWNSESRAVVYASTTAALALLEYLVHTDASLVPDDLVLMRLDLPVKASGASVTPDKLPADWRGYPAPEWQAELGDEWLDDGTFLYLIVPSAISPDDFNILINPLHTEMAGVRILERRPVTLDPRLF